MLKIWRSILILLTFLISVTILSAQDSAETITVVGSGIVNPALESVISASETELEFDVTTTGTSAGFEQFCAGEAAMATASRNITLEETTACRDAEVGFFELLIGYNMLTLISHPADSFALCLTAQQINQIFAPSSTGVITNWDQLNTEPATEGTLANFPELDMQVLVPEDTTLTYAELDNIVNGVGFRADATSTDFESIIETVRTTSGAIGAVPYEMAVMDAEIIPVSIEFAGSEMGCTPPDVQLIEAGFYPAATPLYVYVNKAQQEELGDFLDFLASDLSADAVISVGFSPASLTGYETNVAIISGEQDTRTVTVDEASYEIPPVLAGEITIAGATTLFNLFDRTTAPLTETHTNLTVNQNFDGAPAGITAYCNGEVDILVITGDNAIECDGETPETLSLPLGYQGVVLVGNEADEFTVCLTTEQIRTIWGASSTDTVMQWSDVAESMPEQVMTLFGIRESSDIITDIMLKSDSGVSLPIRIDTEINFDPLYRAAAVANVEGSLTYMRWSDYVRVMDNAQERIQVVLVDGGNGCVEPSESSIASGAYPLSLQSTILVNKVSLADVVVQSYLWTMFGESNLAFWTSAGFVGTDSNALALIREELLIQFTDASLAAAQNAAAEATEEAPEPSAEATEESESGD